MKVQVDETLGAYTIRGQLGRGGMATVFRAHRDDLDRDVAIKVLPEFFADEPGFRERFEQEAVALAKLRHPNIPIVFESGEDRGRAYIVSEFVDGGTLDAQLGRPIPVDRVVAILRPIAQALDYAHANDIMHRDVKPSNILLRSDGTPLLSDFGLAKISGTSFSLTRTGSILGTPEYMSPEQCNGDELTAQSDLYSLAVVAYQMLTGEKPFTAQTPAAVLVAQLTAPLPLPRKVNPKLPVGVEVALLKALAKSPQDRPASCEAFIDGLVAGATERDREPTPRWFVVLLAIAVLGTVADAIFTANFFVGAVNTPQFCRLDVALPEQAVVPALQLGFALLTLSAFVGFWIGARWWRASAIWGLAAFGVLPALGGFASLIATLRTSDYCGATQSGANWTAEAAVIDGLVFAIPYAVFAWLLSRRSRWAQPIGWLASAMALLSSGAGLAVLTLWALRKPFTPTTGR